MFSSALRRGMATVIDGSAPAQTPARWVWIAEAAGFLLAYFLLDWVSYVHVLGHSGITPWNPTTGLIVTSIIARGPRFALFIFPAVMLSDLMIREPRADWLPSLGVSTVITCVYGLAGLILRRQFDPASWLDSLRNMTWLASVGIAAGLMSALGVTVWYRTLGLLDARHFVDGLLCFWVGDAIGVLVAGPTLLLLFRPSRFRLALRDATPRPESLLQTASLLAALWIAFGQDLTLDLNDENTLLYILFLPIVWIAVRNGIIGVVPALVVVHVVMIFALQIQGYSTIQVIFFQIFLLSLTVAGLFIGSAVAEREAATRALAESEARLNAIQTTAPDGIIVLDGRGLVIAVNRAAEQILRRPADAQIGRPVSTLLPGYRAEHDGPVELAVPPAGGRSRHVELTQARTTEPRALVTIILRDISDRKEAEARTHSLRLALAHATRVSLVGEMTSAIVHEISQPIAALATYLSAGRRMLIDPATPGEGALAMIDRASEQARRSGRVLSRLKEFLQRGEIALESTDIHAIIDEAVALAAPDAAERDITLTATIAPDLPPVRAERVHLEQVILNLVRNSMESIEVSDDMRKTISIDVRRSGADIMVTVDDTGGGIDPAIIDDLFRPFATTKASGMGLGLSICRTIVEAHGGRLGYRPRSGGGSSFHFTLPVTPHV